MACKHQNFLNCEPTGRVYLHVCIMALGTEKSDCETSQRWKRIQEDVHLKISQNAAAEVIRRYRSLGTTKNDATDSLLLRGKSFRLGTGDINGN